MLTVPAATAVTTPAEETVAIDVPPLLHVPPPTDAERVVVLPIQRLLLPVIAAADVIVIDFVT